MTSLLDDVLDFEVDIDRCLSDIPCQHQVVITTKNWRIKTKLLRGDQILKLYEKLNMEVPEHFQQYKDNEDTKK